MTSLAREADQSMKRISLISGSTRLRNGAVSRGRLWFSLALLGLSLAGSPSSAQVPPTGDAAIGHEAPDFALRSLAGPNLRLSDRRGEVVLLSFWTSWCSSCKAQLERAARLHDTYGSAGLVVIGISLDDDRAKAVKFAAANGGSVTQALDSTKDTARAYHINDVPLTILVDRAGIVRYVHGEFSRRDDGDLVEQVRRLLDE